MLLPGFMPASLLALWPIATQLGVRKGKPNVSGIAIFQQESAVDDMMAVL